jgi:ParB-like chromosome segregation protein Spo0J
VSLDLTIDAEFQSLIAPLTPQEFDLLRAQILEQGCLQPLCVWKTEDGQRILLDGHNRLRICTDDNRRFNTVNIRLASRDHAKLWILEHQAGRRNLTDDQRAVVWNELREQRSRIVQAEKLRKARDVRAGISISVNLAEIEPPKRDTRAEVAKEAHLPESKLRRAQKLKKYQPQLYEKVLRGELTLRDVVKEFPDWRKKAERPRNHDHFRHLGHLLDRVFKGTLKARLDYLVRLKPKDMTPTMERNVQEIISILADVSRRADGYASSLEKLVRSTKKRKAA